MVKKTLFVVALTLTLSASYGFGQNCDLGGCGVDGGVQGHGCLQSVGIGGLYSRNCGRAMTTQQAAGLWSNYCNDDCSFSGGCGCGLFQGGCLRKLFGGGCGSACDANVTVGCGCDANVNGCGVDGGHVGTGCGCDAGCPALNGCGLAGRGFGWQCRTRHRCGVLRGLFGRLGQGCGCYQECFGYPGHSACGGATRFGRSACGSGCGCGLGGGRLHGLMHRTFGAVGGLKSNGCCGLRGSGCFGRRGHLFGGGLFSRCFHRAGRCGCNGGYFHDTPFTASDQFGFYSSGCGCEGSHATMSPAGCSTGATMSPVGATMQSQMPATNSLMPAGEVISGEVINGNGT